MGSADSNSAVSNCTVSNPAASNRAASGAHIASPVAARPAATVLLVRDHPHPPAGRPPLQVFLQRRVPQMAFAAGMTVFPGGSVDPSDVPDPAFWAGPEPAFWAERIGIDADLAGATVLAAVRETFEECGVLLAGHGAPPAAGRRWRAALAEHRTSLTELLAAAGLPVRADLLAAWSRWITPPRHPRRYDTVFFVAELPAAQEADAHTSEAVEAAWWFPAEALEHGRAGRITLMRPTLHTLARLAEHEHAAEALATARTERLETFGEDR